MRNFRNMMALELARIAKLVVSLNQYQKNLVKEMADKRCSNLEYGIFKKGRNVFDMRINRSFDIEVPEEVKELLESHGFAIGSYKDDEFYKDTDVNHSRPLRFSTCLRQMKDVDDVVKNRMQKMFNERHGSGNASSSEYVCVITNVPADVGGMSTDREWTSCMRLPNGINDRGGEYYETALTEVKNGGMCAYLTDKDDKLLKRPIARIAIKRLVGRHGGYIFLPENKVYGRADFAMQIGFPQFVAKKLDESNNETFNDEDSFRNINPGWSDSKFETEHFLSKKMKERMLALPSDEFEEEVQRLPANDRILLDYEYNKDDYRKKYLAMDEESFLLFAEKYEWFNDILNEIHLDYMQNVLAKKADSMGTEDFIKYYNEKICGRFPLFVSSELLKRNIGNTGFKAEMMKSSDYEELRKNIQSIQGMPSELKKILVRGYESRTLKALFKRKSIPEAVEFLAERKCNGDFNANAILEFFVRNIEPRLDSLSDEEVGKIIDYETYNPLSNLYLIRGLFELIDRFSSVILEKRHMADGIDRMGLDEFNRLVGEIGEWKLQDLAIRRYFSTRNGNGVLGDLMRMKPVEIVRFAGKLERILGSKIIDEYARRHDIDELSIARAGNLDRLVEMCAVVSHMNYDFYKEKFDTAIRESFERMLLKGNPIGFGALVSMISDLPSEMKKVFIDCYDEIRGIDTDGVSSVDEIAALLDTGKIEKQNAYSILNGLGLNFKSLDAKRFFGLYRKMREFDDDFTLLDKYVRANDGMQEMIRNAESIGEFKKSLEKIYYPISYKTEDHIVEMVGRRIAGRLRNNTSIEPSEFFETAWDALMSHGISRDEYGELVRNYVSGERMQREIGKCNTLDDIDNLCRGYSGLSVVISQAIMQSVRDRRLVENADRFDTGGMNAKEYMDFLKGSGYDGIDLDVAKHHFVDTATDDKFYSVGLKDIGEVFAFYDIPYRKMNSYYDHVFETMRGMDDESLVEFIAKNNMFSIGTERVQKLANERLHGFVTGMNPETFKKIAGNSEILWNVFSDANSDMSKYSSMPFRDAVLAMSADSKKQFSSEYDAHALFNSMVRKYLSENKGMISVWNGMSLKELNDFIGKMPFDYYSCVGVVGEYVKENAGNLQELLGLDSTEISKYIEENGLDKMRYYLATAVEEANKKRSASVVDRVAMKIVAGFPYNMGIRL